MRQQRGTTGEEDFQAYVRDNSSYLDYVGWSIYDTQIYKSGITTELNFFRGPQPGQGEQWTNMDLCGTLPNPHAFLIRHILLFGISSNIALGCFTFQVGARLYHKSPAWLHTVRPRWDLKPGIFIPPLYAFQGRLTWETAEQLGAGLSGRPKSAAAIQIALVGLLATVRQ